MATVNVKAEVTGTVIQVPIQEGNTVQAGQEIIVLESMKMEMPILAEAEGVVSLKVKEGDTVEEGQLLAVIES